MEGYTKSQKLGLSPEYVTPMFEVTDVAFKLFPFGNFSQGLVVCRIVGSFPGDFSRTRCTNIC